MPVWSVLEDAPVAQNRLRLHLAGKVLIFILLCAGIVALFRLDPRSRTEKLRWTTLWSTGPQGG